MFDTCTSEDLAQFVCFKTSPHNYSCSRDPTCCSTIGEPTSATSALSQGHQSDEHQVGQTQRSRPVSPILSMPEDRTVQLAVQVLHKDKEQFEYTAESHNRLIPACRCECFDPYCGCWLVLCTTT